MNAVLLILIAMCGAILGALVLLQSMKRPSYGWFAFLLLQLPALTSLTFFLTADWSPEATIGGQLQVLSQVFGTVLTYGIIGALGLLWRPDRALGMLVVMILAANSRYIFAFDLIQEPIDAGNSKIIASLILGCFFAVWRVLGMDEKHLAISVPDFAMPSEILAAIIGACGACVLTIAAIALGGDSRLLYAAISDPLVWLTTPAVLGAAAGAAVGYLRRK